MKRALISFSSKYPVPIEKSRRAKIHPIANSAVIKKNQKNKKKKSEEITKGIKIAPQKKKLSKADPDFYSIIGSISGNILFEERGREYFSEIAKKSHPRAVYHGGRPKKNKEVA